MKPLSIVNGIRLSVEMKWGNLTWWVECARSKVIWRQYMKEEFTYEEYVLELLWRDCTLRRSRLGTTWVGSTERVVSLALDRRRPLSDETESVCVRRISDGLLRYQYNVPQFYCLPPTVQSGAFFFLFFLWNNNFHERLRGAERVVWTLRWESVPFAFLHHACAVVIVVVVVVIIIITVTIRCYKV